MSVLKPLKGVDDGLAENLETFFNLDYPDYELLFSTSDENDPACAIVERLIRRYPWVKSRLFVGAIGRGANPKVNNMIRTYEAASNDWILVSDSNIRVERDYLKRLMAHVETGVGMITSVVAGTAGEGVGGQLEAVTLNTFYARGMHLAAAFNRPTTVGKSMLFQRSTANRFGGIGILAQYLAEDFMAGEAMRKLGLRVVIAADPVNQYLGRISLHDFWARHVRWGRIRRSQAPLVFAIEPLFSLAVSGALGALAFHGWLQVAPTAFFTVHLGLWALCDYLQIISMGTQTPIHTPLIWFIREALHLPLWLHIATGNTVLWRGKRLTVQPGGLISQSRNRSNA